VFVHDKVFTHRALRVGAYARRTAQQGFVQLPQAANPAAAARSRGRGLRLRPSAGKSREAPDSRRRSD
jgi:hypothetical protein